MSVNLSKDQLNEMLTDAAQLGAAIAIRNLRIKGMRKRWILKEEAADLLNKSVHTLYRLEKEGKIIKSPSGYYDKHSIENYLENG